MDAVTDHGPFDPEVIGLGELLWDCFPQGRKPGGAPANVAFHARQLGRRAAVATRVGIDELGQDLLSFLTAQHLSLELVQRDAQHGTGTVTVTPKGTHQDYVFLEDSAWDFLEFDDRWASAFSRARAVVFGTLAQRGTCSRQTVQKCLRATPDSALRVFDINLRPPFYSLEVIEESLQLANTLKLNDYEAKLLAGLLHAPSLNRIELMAWLGERYHLQLVCMTCGADGAIAWSSTEECEVAGRPIEVADTVGAGDAFTAALVVSQLEGWSLHSSLSLANAAGALVASRAGAMPDVASEFQELLRVGEEIDPAATAVGSLAGIAIM